MHWLRRRSSRVVFSVVLLISCTLIALSMGYGLQNETDAAPVEQVLAGPELNLHYGRHSLQMTITSTSTAYEEAILEQLSQQFAGMRVRVDFRVGLSGPLDWDTVSARLLQVIGATIFAEVSLQDAVLKIRGSSVDAVQYQQRLQLLADALPAEIELRSDIEFIDLSASQAALCAQSFQGVTKETVKFRQSSTEFRPSSYPALDRLVEFAYDCREVTIAIIGHTDSTGDETWNKQLSRARAEAVASYLADNGIESSQLVVEGRGSNEPIADNGTVVGRERNRRIELELR